MLHIIAISKAIGNLKIVRKGTPYPLSWVLYQPSVPRNCFNILENMLEYEDLHMQIVTGIDRRQLPSNRVTLYVLKPPFFLWYKPKGIFGNGFEFSFHILWIVSPVLKVFFISTKWLCAPQRIKWMHLKYYFKFMRNYIPWKLFLTSSSLEDNLHCEMLLSFEKNVHFKQRIYTVCAF